MRITIDTQLQVMKLNSGINLGALFSDLNEFFPEQKWEAYWLEVGTLPSETPLTQMAVSGSLFGGCKVDASKITHAMDGSLTQVKCDG